MLDSEKIGAVAPAKLLTESVFVASVVIVVGCVKGPPKTIVESLCFVVPFVASLTEAINRVRIIGVRRPVSTGETIFDVPSLVFFHVFTPSSPVLRHSSPVVVLV